MAGFLGEFQKAFKAQKEKQAGQELKDLQLKVIKAKAKQEESLLNLFSTIQGGQGGGQIPTQPPIEEIPPGGVSTSPGVTDLASRIRGEAGGGTGQPTEGGGLPGAAADLQLQKLFENPVTRGLLKKNFGIEPEKQRIIKGLAGKGGRPVSRRIGEVTGKQFGVDIPESTPLQRVETVTPEGTFTTFVNPFDTKTEQGKMTFVDNPQNPEETIPVKPKGIKTAPITIDTVKTTSGGETFMQDINAVDRSPIGPKRKIVEEKEVSAESAGKIALAQTGLDELAGILSSFFDEKGDLQSTNIINASFNTPFSEGRTAKQAWRRGVDGIIRAATGAAIPPSEWKFYESAYLPGPFDSKTAVKNKMIAFEKFLNNYLSVLDPTGRMKAKFSTKTSVEKEAPEEAQGQADFEFIPGQGLVPIAR